VSGHVPIALLGTAISLPLAVFLQLADLFPELSGEDIPSAHTLMGSAVAKRALNVPNNKTHA